MHLRSIILALIPLIGTVLGQSDWTEDETVIIYKKVRALFEEPRMKIIKQMKKNGFNKKDYTKGTNFPSAAKVHCSLPKTGFELTKIIAVTLGFETCFS